MFDEWHFMGYELRATGYELWAGVLLSWLYFRINYPTSVWFKASRVRFFCFFAVFLLRGVVTLGKDWDRSILTISITSDLHIHCSRKFNYPSWYRLTCFNNCRHKATQNGCCRIFLNSEALGSACLLMHCLSLPMIAEWFSSKGWKTVVRSLRNVRLLRENLFCRQGRIGGEASIVSAGQLLYDTDT